MFPAKLRRFNRSVLRSTIPYQHCSRSHASTVKQFTAKPLSPSIISEEKRRQYIQQIWLAKEAKEITIDEIAKKLGYTNVYTAQILNLQAPLNPEKACELCEILGFTIDPIYSEILEEMQKAPKRRFDQQILQEPNVLFTYRLLEAVQHNAESLKQVVNEKFGDGIMSAIDFHLNVSKIKGAQGEDRVVITFDGKFLPFIEQKIDNQRTVDQENAQKNQ
ncbi:hypothetical protein RFI_14020 [Reticulomyxa filosa]|uniref:HTH cro/C1-type domain-containing protein n=1 Tax=Reticulomyxa filosa TaxID=46433 RepID=X6NA40_RETFI|nr:hypothetical protein RFI_14020 [Reticulomyxa filosa]|eukprot:ETO23165.1 hypothetical protein RFI_14020 [Reticulomyxa filosa]